jgi:hypothetical protein
MTTAGEEPGQRPDQRMDDIVRDAYEFYNNLRTSPTGGLDKGNYEGDANLKRFELESRQRIKVRPGLDAISMHTRQ